MTAGRGGEGGRGCCCTALLSSVMFPSPPGESHSRSRNGDEAFVVSAGARSKENGW
jgi:hypothetical protein